LVPIETESTSRDVDGYWKLSDGWDRQDFWRFMHGDAGWGKRKSIGKSKTAVDLARERRKLSERAKQYLTPLPPQWHDKRLEAACNNRDRKYGSYERHGRSIYGRGVWTAITRCCGEVCT
jgi:hypothetical protein